MPFYDFKCSKCEHIWDEMTSHDPSDKYEKIVCPECGSKKKEKLFPSSFSIGGPTSSKMDNFGYRAGFNWERAQGERRAAEEAAGGSSPYRDTNDFALGEGIHDPETRPGMS